MKVLFFERSGWCILAKHLERGSFKLPEGAPGVTPGGAGRPRPDRRPHGRPPVLNPYPSRQSTGGSSRCWNQSCTREKGRLPKKPLAAE